MPVRGLRTFQRNLRRYVESIPRDQVLPLQKRIAEFALMSVVHRTPRATGHAKGNWHVSINQPSFAELRRNDVEGDETIRIGAAVINSQTAFCGMFIQNNVPYIIYLENGWSDQAPAGMLRPTIAELNLMIRAAM